MNKNYKKKVIVTSLITLSPMLIGLVLWNRLPDTLATHFGSDNIPNGWSSKFTSVIGIPLLLTLVQLFVSVVTANDPKRKNIDDKFMGLILWLVPLCSLFCCFTIYTTALGYAVDVPILGSILVGVIFIVIGNYMHKIKQNFTVGIKIPWTLHSEENWNRTHRLSSWMWILSGIIFMVSGFLKLEMIQFVSIAAAVLVPMVYSFILFKKGI